MKGGYLDDEAFDLSVHRKKRRGKGVNTRIVFYLRYSDIIFLKNLPLQEISPVALSDTIVATRPHDRRRRHERKS